MSLRSATLAILTVLTVSACAQIDVEAPRWLRVDPPVVAPHSAATRPPEPPPARPKNGPGKAATSQPAAPEPLPPALVGMSETETEGLLGRPSEEADRPPGKAWIYQGPGCRLTVHLFPDMEKGGFYALDYTVEDGSREVCLGKVAGEVRKRG